MCSSDLQLLDFGPAKRLTPIPTPLDPRVMDNGRYYMLDNLVELPFAETPHRVITKGLDVYKRQVSRPSSNLEDQSVTKNPSKLLTNMA